MDQRKTSSSSHQPLILSVELSEEITHHEWKKIHYQPTHFTPQTWITGFVSLDHLILVGHNDQAYTFHLKDYTWSQSPIQRHGYESLTDYACLVRPGLVAYLKPPENIADPKPNLAWFGDFGSDSEDEGSSPPKERNGYVVTLAYDIKEGSKILFVISIWD